MAAQKKKSKAAAAKDETAPAPKAIEWQGLTLELPSELPESIIFDVVEVEAEGGLLPMIRTLRSVLGREQFTQVRNKLDHLGEDADTEGLFDSIFGEYGMALGES